MDGELNFFQNVFLNNEQWILDNHGKVEIISTISNENIALMSEIMTIGEIDKEKI